MIRASIGRNEGIVHKGWIAGSRGVNAAVFDGYARQ
jgi:hypothetical protein